MLGKVKEKEGILIEKKNGFISSSKNQASKLLSMKYGTHSYHGDEKEKKKPFYTLLFMTKKGVMSFNVDVSMYRSFEINSYGILYISKGKLIQFDFKKIVTKKDVELLNW